MPRQGNCQSGAQMFFNSWRIDSDDSPFTFRITLNQDEIGMMLFVRRLDANFWGRNGNVEQLIIMDVV